MLKCFTVAYISGNLNFPFVLHWVTFIVFYRTKFGILIINQLYIVLFGETSLGVRGTESGFAGFKNKKDAFIFTIIPPGRPPACL